MTLLTITAKGQVTLSKSVRDRLGLQPGDKIELDYLPDGRAAFGAPRRTGKISDAFGILKRENQRAVPVEELNEAIAQAGAEAGMRGL